MPLWGSAATDSMWLAVLVVGVWGGNGNTTSAGGASSSWPVVATIALFALIATVPVARCAFRASPEREGLRSAIEDEQRARAAGRRGHWLARKGSTLINLEVHAHSRGLAESATW